MPGVLEVFWAQAGCSGGVLGVLELFWVFWPRAPGVLGVLAASTRCSGCSGCEHQVFWVFWPSARGVLGVLGGAGMNMDTARAWSTARTQARTRARHGLAVLEIL